VLIVNSPEVALSISDRDVRGVVWTRFHQITEGEVYDYDRHGELIVVEPGDTVAQLEEESGCPILSDYDGARFGDPEFSPVFEAIEDHAGRENVRAGCYEIVAVVNDDGFGIAIFVPKQPGIDADLIAMCAKHSQPATPVR
jgi:hypothetical protein